MSNNPTSLLGYNTTMNTPHYAGAQTREQWIADMAASLTIRFLNGAEMTEPEMAMQWWQQHGLPDLTYAFGSAAKNPNNAQDPAVYNSMLSVAQTMYQSRGLNLPSVTPISGDDQARIASATQQQGVNQTSIANNTATNAQSAANTAAEQAGALQRTGLETAQRRDDSILRAQVDRESIAAENQRAAATEGGLNRRFDLQIAEDRRQFNERLGEDKRQFNTTTLVGLLDRATELAKAPTDWLAHSYFMNNMGIPLSYMNLTSVATLLGAVPPTGPSGAGPIVGGPAAMDGNTILAQSVGAQAGFVPLSQAAQMNPGTGGDQGAVAQFAAGQTINQMAQQAGGPQQLDQMVEQSRASEVVPAVGLNPVTQKIGASGGALSLWQGANGTPAAPIPQPTPPAAPPMPTMTQPGQPPMPTSETGADTGQGALTPQPLPQGNGSTGPGNSGIYTGQTATAPVGGAGTGVFGQPVAATGTGAQNPQGEQLITAIANELGVPVEQVRAILPPELIAGGYSKEAIINSPVMKAIRDQSQLSFFRTDPVGDSKFGQLQAFGVPLGVRGGQDLNAGTYLKAPEAAQGMIEGAFNAAGRNWNDELKASLRASPTTSYDTGVFGKRRF